MPDPFWMAEMAQYERGVYSQTEYCSYQEILTKLATMSNAQSGSSQQQQSAAGDLKQSPKVSLTTIR